MIVVAKFGYGINANFIDNEKCCMYNNKKLLGEKYV